MVRSQLEISNGHSLLLRICFFKRCSWNMVDIVRLTQMPFGRAINATAAGVLWAVGLPGSTLQMTSWISALKPQACWWGPGSRVHRGGVRSRAAAALPSTAWEDQAGLGAAEASATPVCPAEHSVRGPGWLRSCWGVSYTCLILSWSLDFFLLPTSASHFSLFPLLVLQVLLGSILHAKLSLGICFLETLICG